jgi:hypothetical protein
MASLRTYVGFGFGAIQAGLFLYEAYVSAAFGRMVVAEVLPEVVAAVRNAGGRYRVNIAHRDRIEQADVGPIEIENPAVETDRARLIAAIAEAAEIGTAVPSVRNYTSAAWAACTASSRPGCGKKQRARGHVPSSTRLRITIARPKSWKKPSSAKSRRVNGTRSTGGYAFSTP